MFNRREQLALLFLAGTLLAGTGLALLDYYRPSSLEEFQVLPGVVPVPAPRPSIAAGPIRLNAATAAQLQRLPAIGPKTADSILEYRRAHGPFRTLEELGQVKGIGTVTLEKLRPLVVLD